MSVRPRRRKLKLTRKKQKGDIKKLRGLGAEFVHSPEQLAAKQQVLIERLKTAGLSQKLRQQLSRCKAGRCGRTQCSAACWWGNRGNANALTLQAAGLLASIRGSRRLRFVTIIDPHRAVPMGELHKIPVKALMQAIRRHFRKAESLADAVAFGWVEMAIEVLPDGRELWSPHIHLVLLSLASDEQIKRAFLPGRTPPDPGEWGRKRWKPVLVKEVTDLPYLLDYMAKRDPERKLNREGKSGNERCPDQVRLEQRLEYDRWLLPQTPGENLFLRGIRRVHGRLTLRPLG